MSPPDFVNITSPPAWMAQGLCAQVDPELFYPEKGAPALQPRQVCLTCPVRTDCLAYALDRGERFGVWGGTSERERRRLRHRTRTGPPTETGRGIEAA